MESTVMRKLVFIYSVVMCGLISKDLHAQKKQDFNMAYVGFWNVENLYDTIDDPNKNDEEFLPSGPNKWNSERYFIKLDRLAQVISEMGERSPDGPVVLGLAEIENISVLKDLALRPAIKSRNYIPILVDGPDRRGVDVALMYQPKYFKPVQTKSYTLKIAGDSAFASRDQLVVSGDLLGERFHFIVAHWPSRRGGEKRSRPLRIAAAHLGRKILDSIMTAEPGAKIIYMGDLNDDPINESVKSAIQGMASTVDTTGTAMFNPMFEMHAKGQGSLAYNDIWNLFDQTLVSPELLKKDYTSFRYSGAKVFDKPYLHQQEGKFKGYPWRTYVGSTYMGGYADHFPVYVLLVREK
jgi:hypothetical protein